MGKLHFLAESEMNRLSSALSRCWVFGLGGGTRFVRTVYELDRFGSLFLTSRTRPARSVFCFLVLSIAISMTSYLQAQGQQQSNRPQFERNLQIANLHPGNRLLW